MKAQDEFIRAVPAPTDLHAAAVTEAISALMPQIAATDPSYVHRAEICRHLQNVVYGVSRGSNSCLLLANFRSNRPTVFYHFILFF